MEVEMQNSSNSLRDELSRLEEEQVRSNIGRIISSYRHVWDIYTELLQNSADAIIDQFGEDNIGKGLVSLEIDTEARIIIIKDNGVGISEEDMARILVTGKSLKRERGTGKFGFMGFGFTFVAFQSSSLKIESAHNGYLASRTYHDLYKFAFEEGEIPNSLEEETAILSQTTAKGNFTKIEVKFPLEFPDNTVEQALIANFRIAKSQLLMESVLRTRTSVGCLDPIFGERENFNFLLKIDGNDIEISSRYLTIYEITKKVMKDREQLFYSMDTYEQFIVATEQLPRVPQDQARRSTLLYKLIDNISIGERNSLNVRLYIVATSKQNINDYNSCFRSQGELDSDYEIENGVWLSINGMPTGICLNPFEHSNYLPYTVIVDVKDKSLRKELDAGRKGISDYRRKQISEKVIDILRSENFIKYRQYVVYGDTRINDPLYDPKSELQKLMEPKNFYSSPLIHKYFPPIEEQEVISLFTELISIKYLKGYELKVLSGYQVYDGLYQYELEGDEDTQYSSSCSLGIAKAIFDRQGGTLKRDILVEFKLNLNGIYRDVNQNRKDVSHIDLLICWSVDYDKNSVNLQKEKGDILREKDPRTNVFYGVTHQLIGLNRQQPLPIIELKQVLKTALDLDLQD